MNIKLYQIKDFKEGKNIHGFYLCKNVENKLTRFGDEYLDVLLEDNSGTIRAKIWSYVAEYKTRIQNGKPIAVKGNVISFNNNLELNISNVNIADSVIYKKYGFKESLLVKTIVDDKDKLFNDLMGFIKHLDNDYKRLINKIVKDNINKIKSSPSVDYSYNLNGGLLKQILSVLNLNKKVFTKYKNLDKNIVLSGIIVKNIGSMNYFNDDLQNSVSDENEYTGHKLLGINIINDYAIQYMQFPQKIKTQLQNIVLSENSSNDIHLNYIHSLYQFDLSIHQSLSKEDS